MAGQSPHTSLLRRFWALVRGQHGVVARYQLLALGFNGAWIDHRIATGRLHPVARGVYAVGRPDLTRHGAWMTAVLRCGRGVVLSHESAAMLWGLRRVQRRGTEVSVPIAGGPGPEGISVHRRRALRSEHTVRRLNIPVTGPVWTIVDITPRLRDRQLEAVMNEADALDIVDPEMLRADLERFVGWPGAPRLRKLWIAAPSR